MKRLKKTLSCILALLVLLTTVPVGGLTVSAAAIDHGEILPDTPTTATISVSGDVAVFSFTPTASGYYRFYSDCGEDTYGYIYDANGNQLASNDDGGNDYNFAVTYEMTADVTYQLQARYYDDEDKGSFLVSVEKFTPWLIESVEFHDVSVIEGNTNTAETYDEELGENVQWQRYSYSYHFTITYSDGTTEERTTGYSHDDNVIRDDAGYYYVSATDDQSHTSPWGIGSHTVTGYVQGLDISDTYTVEVIENPIQSVTFSATTIIENTYGYYRTDWVWDEESGQEIQTPEYFCYYDLYPRNPIITLKDGTVIEGNSFEWNGQWHYLNYFISQSYENRWTVGNTYQVNASICGYKFTYDIEIVETPVASVTFPATTIIENTYGYYRTDWVWDDELGQEVETPEYFYYTTDHIFSLSHTITLKDGTVINNNGCSWNGQWYSINYSDDQSYENQWTVGNTYQIKGEILGFEFTRDIEIIDTLIESVTVDPIVRLEETDGYYETESWNDETEQWEQHPEYFHYTDLRPSHFVVTYKDGTVTETDGSEWWGEFSPFSYSDDQSYENQWQAGNTYQVNAELYGYEFTYDVQIKESPIASIVPNKVIKLENRNGYYTTDETWDGDTQSYIRSPEYFYYEDLYPYNSVITLKDGTTSKGAGIWWNGEWLSMVHDYQQSYETRLSAGNTYTFSGRLAGYEFTYDVEIVDTPVATITFDPVTKMEYTDGYYKTETWNAEKEVWEQHAPYYYYYSEYLTPLNPVITLKDGTVIEGNSFAFGDNWYYLDLYTDQSYENPWTAGNTYQVNAEICGYEFTYDVEITAPPVIELDTVQTVTIANGGEVGVFNFTPDESGAYLFGSSSEQDTYGYIYDANGNCLASNDDGGEGNNFMVGYTLTAGVTYQLRARFYNSSNTGSFDVVVTQSPVVSVTAETITRIEHTGGYYSTGSIWDEELGEYVEYRYYYYSSNLHPRDMVVTLKDGTVIEDSSFEWNGQWYTYDNLNYTQDCYNQWTVGNTYPITTTIGGYEFTYDVEIVESPVASVIADLVVRAENSNGYYTSSEIWSEEKDCFVLSPEYFYYQDITPYNNMVITLKDGTKINGGGFDWQGSWYYVEHPDFQNYATRLLPGSNQVTATIAGYEFTYTVEITQLSSNDSFEYYETEDGIIITDSFIYPEMLEIPAEIDGKPVVGVADLNGYYAVKHLVFPDSVKTIGDYVLRDFDSLETVTFGSDIANLYSEMFLYTYSLNKIVVSEDNPNFCTVDGVLYDKAITCVIAYPICRGTAYEVPNTVTDISALQDNYYSGLAITFQSGNPNYVTEDGVTYNASKTQILFCAKDKTGSYVMPDSVTDIAYGAFAGCSQLTEVILSANVTEIVYATFASCTNLTTIDLPQGLISIHDSAFDNTTSLESVDLPDTLTWIGTNAFYGSGLTSLSVPDSVDFIDCQAFADTAIQTLDLGNGIEGIYEYAFSGTPVTAVTLPNSLSYLGSGVFANCGQLKTLSIGSGLTSIYDNTFSNTALESVNIPSNIDYVASDAFAYSAIKTLTLNEGLERIGDSAFYGCRNLTSVTIPSSVQIILERAFAGCDSLTSLNVAEGNATYHSDGNCIIETDNELLYIGCGGSVIPTDGTVTRIYNNAFYDCDNLDSITIPNTITEIGYQAFSDCDALQSIIIPDSVETIDAEAFMDCDNLASVVLGDGIIDLGSSVFAYCPLTDVDLGYAITAISPYAFAYTDLTTLFIPATVTDITYGAFAGCTDLTSIELPTSVQSIQDNVFADSENLTDVYYQGTEEDRANMYISEYGNEPLFNATWHYGWANTKWDVSTECKHVYDDDYDVDCNNCGAIREVGEMPTITVDGATARAEETVTVAIRLTNNIGIVSAKLAISYDESKLELVSYEEQDFADLSYGPEANNPFIVNWCDPLNDNVIADGTFVLLTFRIKADAEVGETTVSVSYDPEDVYNYDFENVTFDTVDGTINIVDYISGDVNGDGTVNNKDIGLLQRFITGWDVEIDHLASDVNGDGKINNRDAGILQRYLNGWDIELT